MKHNIVPTPTDTAGICRAALEAAIDLGCEWTIQAPRRPGAPFVLRIWEPKEKERTPDENGQTKSALKEVP